jgi:hypothetical protein
MTAMTFALGGISFWIRTYVNEYRGLNDEAATGTTFGAIVVVTGLAATLFGGWLGDRLRARFSGSYFLVSADRHAASASRSSWACSTRRSPPAWVFLAAAVFCLFLNTGPSNTIIANVTPAPLRSTAFAVSIFTIHALGDVISPPIIGRICDATRTAALPHGDMNKAFLAISLAMLAQRRVLGPGRQVPRQATPRAPRARANRRKTRNPPRNLTDLAPKSRPPNGRGTRVSRPLAHTATTLRP